MKNKILFFALIGTVLTAGTISCKPNYQTDFELKSLSVPHRDLSLIQFGLDGGQREIRIETNLSVDSWTATPNADWVKVTKSADKVTIASDKNELFITRNARVTIAYGHQIYTVDVRQFGNESVMLIDGAQSGIIKSVSGGGGEVSVMVTTNLHLDHITIPDSTSSWVSFVSITPTTNPTQKIVTFNVGESDLSTVRFSTIRFQSSQNFTNIGSFVMMQNPGATPIQLRLDMVSGNAIHPSDGGGLAALIDGDVGTFCHTHYGELSPGSKPHYIQINFDEPLNMLRFSINPRDGNVNNAGTVVRYGIWVSDTGETGLDANDEWLGNWVKVETDVLPRQSPIPLVGNWIIFNTPQQYVRFIPESRVNQDPLDATNTGQAWFAIADLFIDTK
jgi:hypothetical protein